MGRKQYDILLEDDFDLLVKDGDFVIGESTEQHQKLMLLCRPGEIKYAPWAGVGLGDFILDDAGILDLHSRIQQQFELDGMNVQYVKGNSIDTIDISAEYK